MSLFSSLGTAYSGMKVSQVSTEVISSNIANAQNEYYTRRRVEISENDPLKISPGDIGTGAEVSQVLRIHDEFIFSRYRNASGTLQYTEYQRKILEEISTFFPDVDEVGIQRDLSNFFDAWQKFGSNPSDSAQKIVLAQATQTLSRNIKELRTALTDTQDNIDTLMVSSVNEINRLAERISEINKEIRGYEGVQYNRANALRDERDKLEIALSDLVAPNISKTGLKSLTDVDQDIADYGENYVIQVAGYPIVDNDGFHPLVIDKAENSKGGLSSVYFQSQDRKLTDISNSISGGKLGAMLDLRGKRFDAGTGVPADGILQDYIDKLDVFARGIIQSVNNVYALSADTQMVSDKIGDSVGLTANQMRMKVGQLYPGTLKSNVQAGTLTISSYDITGQRNRPDLKIDLDPTNQSMQGILNQINNELAANGINATAKYTIGTLYIEPGGGSGDETGAVLIKSDTSLLLNALDLTGSKALSSVDETDIPFEITNGTFEVNVFTDDGAVAATRTVTINKDSSDPLYSTLQGIAAQINMVHIDDNGDNDYTNDVDDAISASFINNHFVIQTKNDNAGVYFNIDDQNTGFAGAMGLHKFFEGDNANDINLKREFREQPALINAYGNPVEGDNETANAMQQLQYEDVPFFYQDGSVRHETLLEGYKYLAATVAEDTDSVQLQNDTATALYNSIKEKQFGISQVNIDEELTNLIKYQTGYGANAKTIQTIQSMLDTLLSLKT